MNAPTAVLALVGAAAFANLFGSPSPKGEETTQPSPPKGADRDPENRMRAEYDEYLKSIQSPGVDDKELMRKEYEAYLQSVRNQGQGAEQKQIRC